MKNRIKDTAQLIALGIVGTTLFLYILSAFIPVDPKTLDDMRNLSMIATGYYLGSSAGSKEKTTLLNKKEDEK